VNLQINLIRHTGMDTWHRMPSSIIVVQHVLVLIVSSSAILTTPLIYLPAPCAMWTVSSN